MAIFYKIRLVFSFSTANTKFIEKGEEQLKKAEILKAQPAWILPKHFLDCKFMRTIRRPEDNAEVSYIMTYSENVLTSFPRKRIIMEIDCKIAVAWIGNFVADGEILPQQQGSNSGTLEELLIKDFMTSEIDVDLIHYDNRDGYKIYGLIEEPLVDRHIDDAIDRADG